jgi:hypothetical protein
MGEAAREEVRVAAATAAAAMVAVRVAVTAAAARVVAEATVAEVSAAAAMAGAATARAGSDSEAEGFVHRPRRCSARRAEAEGAAATRGGAAATAVGVVAEAESFDYYFFATAAERVWPRARRRRASSCPLRAVGRTQKKRARTGARERQRPSRRLVSRAGRIAGRIAPSRGCRANNSE